MPKGLQGPIVSSDRRIGAGLPIPHLSSRRGDLLGWPRSSCRAAPGLRAHPQRSDHCPHIGHLCTDHTHHSWNPLRGRTRCRAWLPRSVRHQLRQRHHDPPRGPGRPARRPPRRRHNRPNRTCRRRAASVGGARRARWACSPVYPSEWRGVLVQWMVTVPRTGSTSTSAPCGIRVVASWAPVTAVQPNSRATIAA